MTFAMFVIWALMGVLGGVLAGWAMKRGGHSLKRDIKLGLVGSIGVSWLLRGTGMIAGSSLFIAAFVALVGAGLVIVAQRMIRPTEQHAEPRADVWWRWSLGAIVAVVTGWMLLAPAPPPAAAAVDDKTYDVTPATITLKVGFVTGEVTGMKVTERIEQGSGRIVTPAKLTGRIALKNTSENQTVRLITGKLQYLDMQGRPMTLEDNRADPIIKFTSSERLDPGQETTESLEADFPVEALKANTLKTIRLNLAYVPSPYRQHTADLPVTIGGK